MICHCSIPEVFLPESGSDLWVCACRWACLTTMAVFKPPCILATPDTLDWPWCWDKDLGAIHKLLSVGSLHSNLGPIVCEMRADLPPLIHDKAKAKLEIDLRNFEYRLVVVESIEVHSARQLELVLKIVDQVKSQVLYWRRFSTCVSILIVLPS